MLGHRIFIFSSPLFSCIFLLVFNTLYKLSLCRDISLLINFSLFFFHRGGNNLLFICSISHDIQLNWLYPRIAVQDGQFVKV